MIEQPICPCDVWVHPHLITNLPVLPALSYRVGTYTTFRHALLLSQPDEIALALWRPSASGDLTLQMVEWWAYLADILTFYNERVADETYLRTATLPESVRRIIRLLGYRPRPGIGATGVVAALPSGPGILVLPRGLAIGSTPPPGKQAQVFETDAAATFIIPPTVRGGTAALPAAIAAEAPPNDALLVDGGVLLRGVVATIKADDTVLLMERQWAAANQHYALVKVTGVEPEKDPHGKTNTRVLLSGTDVLPTDALASNYRLLRDAYAAHVWAYNANGVITDTTAHLEAITRSVKVRDPILFEIPGGAPAPQLASVTAYTEVVWLLNAPDPAQPENPAGLLATTPAIPAPHTQLTFQAPAGVHIGDFDAQRTAVIVRHGWQDVGTLMATPASLLATVPPTLALAIPATLPDAHGADVLVEDAVGKGVQARAVNTAASTLALTDVPDTGVTLVPPLRMLFDLLAVSRGKSVFGEILGSGDARIAAQEFVLQELPLTYLASGDGASGEQYTSTLRVFVDNIEWYETPDFYALPPDARIFVTREDEDQKTHVLFGDGINGARLPSGTKNVVAWYRYGSGADAPPAGTVNVIPQPQPNLAAIRNPVAVGGGADPDPPAQIRRYAPRSVLTFGRAVSGDDYETIAAQTPGVARARAVWGWDPDRQRTAVTVYVGDDAAAVSAARTALAKADDPNRPVAVKLATRIPVALSLALHIAADHLPEPVIAAARAALLDPETGLFGVDAVRIGQSLFRSQIEAALLAVPGTEAVHHLSLRVERYDPWPIAAGIRAAAWRARAFPAPRHTRWLTETGFRATPGEGGFFTLAPEDLDIAPEVING